MSSPPAWHMIGAMFHRHHTGPDPMTPVRNRLCSLDAFRGLTIAAMILVNCPGTYGSVYPQLRHAEWNGWTFTDTIFPAFLFIMGVSMVFSFAGRKQNGAINSRLQFQIVKRTLILFALGLFINDFPVFHLSTIRVPGVLQRIALCYFFTSLIILKSSVRGQVCWLIGLLSSYWLMMRFVPVPEIGTGVLEPGRNFAAYIDSLFLDGHMWMHYETWDPEGLLSTIPAIGTTLFGVLAAHWLRSDLPGGRKVIGLFLAGVVLFALGWVLGGWFPINKSIWTSTFSIFMAGIASIGLALFYWIIDLQRLQAVGNCIRGFRCECHNDVRFVGSARHAFEVYAADATGRIDDQRPLLRLQDVFRPSGRPGDFLPAFCGRLRTADAVRGMDNVEKKDLRKDLARLHNSLRLPALPERPCPWAVF